MMKTKQKISEYGYLWKNDSKKSTPSVRELIIGIRKYWEWVLRLKLEGYEEERKEVIIK